MSNKEIPDWETLNAYVDGELSPEREAWVKNACKGNPNLTSEIARLVILKKALSSKPAIHKRGWNSDKLKWKVVSGSAVMVMLLMVFLGMSQFGGYTSSSFQSWAMEKHDALSERSFVVSDFAHKPLIAASIRGALQAPDLTGSKLYLVDVTIQRFDEKDGIVMHYRGLRGCRVSFLLAPKDQDTDSFDTGISKEMLLLGRGVASNFWESSRFKFGLLASGMDEKRFKSISSYLKLKGELNLPATKEEQYVMDQAYEASEVCA
ncbi:anti-sigma factor family protein [Kiloniella antarctica]|uniref:Anti-sigma factor family protein n=1 Tax=Kiloniella antarctica TaxID=1550907 RepID=A0ABW5BF30_9PROT